MHQVFNHFPNKSQVQDTNSSAAFTHQMKALITQCQFYLPPLLILTVAVSIRHHSPFCPAAEGHIVSTKLMVKDPIHYSVHHIPQQPCGKYTHLA